MTPTTILATAAVLTSALVFGWLLLRRRATAQRPAGGVDPGVIVIGSAFLLLGGAGLYVLVDGSGAGNVAAARWDGAGHPQIRAAQSGTLPDVDTMVSRLAARLEAHPDDPDGWRMLGWSLVALDRPAEAVDAYRHAIALRGSVARYRAGLGEALTKAAGGTVTPEALDAFREAERLDSRDQRTRYYLGLAKRQAGESRAAYDIWASLAKDGPADSPWVDQATADAASLAKTLGIPAPEVAGPAPTERFAGPSAADVAAAQSMSPEGRQAMIHGMVERLAARLEKTPDDAGGWARLGRSYVVLGEREKAAAAYAQLIRLRPGDPRALESYARALIGPAAPPAGYPPAATEALARLLTIEPDNTYALFHLGAAAKRAGDRALAAKHWQRLLAQLPEGSDERRNVAAELSSLEPRK